MQNLEQKFACADLAATERLAVALGATDGGTFRQRDYFFPAPLARLKLRTFPDAPACPAELIAYVRPDAVTARNSTYQIALLPDPAAALATLTLALGPPRVLSKTRHLLLYRHTRIHLDSVESIGDFCELETVFPADGSLGAADAAAELQTVVAALQLARPIATAYVDLLFSRVS